MILENADAFPSCGVKVEEVNSMSCGSSGTGETQQVQSDEEAHRTHPRGKQVPRAEINGLNSWAITATYEKKAFLIYQIKGGIFQ
ncbi:hypothetical protein [Cytobacillus sp. BC1816]|uniref:hypothetical protein n=1 Tax=Cytobacillus sp. BC1816 TaxID=3440154 RepID=UPI003F51606B